MKKYFFMALVGIAALTGCNRPHWTSLFNGKDLPGWFGSPAYCVEKLTRNVTVTGNRLLGSGEAGLIVER